MKFKPTEEQAAIRDFIATSKEGLEIRAHAGAAKTSTLELSAPGVPESETPAALAFNVKIKKELEARLPGHFKVLTMNGAGHRAWGKTIGRALTLDERKAASLVSQSLGERGLSHDRELRDEIRELVDLARTYGLVPNGAPGAPKRFVPDEEHIWCAWAAERTIDMAEQKLEIVREILLRGILAGFQGRIDYNDQIYLSACYHGTFQKHRTVFVDEAQDLSALNQYMLRKMVTKRLIAVGDSKQAIYGFRGAMHDSMDTLKTVFAPMSTLTLSTTFRCAKAIVDHVQDHAPGIRAADWAPIGEVAHLRSLATHAILPGSLVACRNHAPLLKLGLKLLRDGIPATFIKGDIRKAIEKIITKIARDPSTSTEDLLKALDAFEFNNQDSAAVADRIECIRVLAEGTRTVADILSKIAAIFAVEDAAITLGTGHAAKGLEFENVYHLDSWRIPSRYASTPEQIQQEYNINYVIATRAKKRLYYIDLVNIT